MFKFNFDIGEDCEDLETNESIQGTFDGTTESSVDERPLVEHLLTTMLDSAPDEISYSSVQVATMPVPRRELFDVRMQLIASEGQHESTDREGQLAIEFVECPSDLVPRVYEGGLKTWECSLDLAAYAGDNYPGMKGKKVLELGCGTAIPTLVLLHNLLNQPPPSDDTPNTVVDLQDYNLSVLECVTLPNIILAWFFSSAGESFRNTLPRPPPLAQTKKNIPNISKLRLDSVPEEADEETEISSDMHTIEPQPESFDPSVPGDLALSSALRSAFLASLDRYKINLRFFSGPWSGFHSRISAPYDLVLTSETIYQPASLPSLVGLLRHATGTGVCLVAAKMVYFGVGGGIREFERALSNPGVHGRTETVWEHREGVGRCILRVSFDK